MSHIIDYKVNHVMIVFKVFMVIKAFEYVSTDQMTVS